MVRPVDLCTSLIFIATFSIEHNRAHAFVASPPSSDAFPKCLSSRIRFSSSNDGLNQHRQRTRGIRSSITNVRRRYQQGTLARAASSVQPASNDPRDEPRTTHKVTIDLPLGLVIEEMDESDPSFGVAIIGINEGNSAKHNSEIISKTKSRGGSTDGCICIRDKIMAVNDVPCADRGFDDVIGLITGTNSDKVTLDLGHLQGSTVVNYYNGICISAKAGESYGFLAGKCGIDIDYECRSGNCQTCVRWMEFPDKDRDRRRSGDEVGKGNLYERTIFHCVGKVPRGYEWLHVLDPYAREIAIPDDS